MPMVYASIAFALGQNKQCLYSTRKQYIRLIKKAKQRPKHKEDTREINFVMGQAARLVHVCGRKYVMPQFLLEKIMKWKNKKNKKREKGKKKETQQKKRGSLSEASLPLMC